MRKVLIIFLSLITVISFAQKKQLTVAQMLQSDHAGLIKEMPLITGWKDNTHYIISRFNDQGKSETVAVDVKTGKEEPYTELNDKPEVIVKGGDIFYRLSTGKEEQLTKTKEEEKNPTLSPDGTKVAFTRNNDLYVIDVNSHLEARMTNDGSDVIYNGWASWVYFEEILGRASRYKAFWWSPDSRRIAYMRFDDSKVPLFPLFSSDGQHGYVENTRYPKAGDSNPEVKMGVVDIHTAETVWADFNEKDDQYFGTPFWSPDGKSLWVQWMNRGQDQLIVYAIDAASGNKKPVYTEQQKTWVDWLENIYFLANNKGYLVQSDKSGWMHIYHYDMNGNLINQITSGDWTVKDILKIDEKEQTIFFTARKENSTRFDLYNVKLNGRELNRLTFGEYTHNVNLSPDGKYFITTCSNINTPNKMALVDVKKKVVKEIANSKGEELDKYQLAKTELIRVKTPDGFELPVLITWPNDMNMDMGKTKKFPVLISIYGGPNAGTVTDGWKGISQNQWWAKEGLIHVAIDHRGSGHFGKMGQNFMYRKLGEWEIKDYIEVVKWLTNNPIVDKSKIAINGFSYGGYITSMALTKGADYFTHGIAGGSVTDWKLYDSHYTERFMDTPAENPEGYKNGSVFNYINNYKGKLYVIHGTMDDNVHMQNSLQLIEALQNAKKDFQFMLYPGGRHGWPSLPKRWAHYNNERTKFFYQHLLEKPVPKEALR